MLHIIYNRFESTHSERTQVEQESGRNYLDSSQSCRLQSSAVNLYCYFRFDQLAFYKSTYVWATTCRSRLHSGRSFLRVLSALTYSMMYLIDQLAWAAGTPFAGHVCPNCILKNVHLIKATLRDQSMNYHQIMHCLTLWGWSSRTWSRKIYQT